MTRLAFVIPIVALLPLVAALLNRTAAMAGLGLAWAAYLGMFLMTSDSLTQSFIGAQTPLFGLLSFMSLVFSKKRSGAEEEQQLAEEQRELEELKKRQKILKQDLALIE